jgi:hypothetical protein
VTSPTIEAPWYALALLVIGFVSTFVLRARDSASTQLADLTGAVPWPARPAARAQPR